jgi:uncharacterized membrane protein YvbJ
MGRQRRWITLGLLLLILIAVGSFIYANRSTPSKTLDTFCNALKTGDSQTAYDLLSPNLQKQVGSEPMWTSNLNQSLSNKKGLKECLQANINDGDSSSSITLIVIYGNGSVIANDVVLIMDNGTWKLDSAKATP